MKKNNIKFDTCLDFNEQWKWTMKKQGLLPAAQLVEVTSLWVESVGEKRELDTNHSVFCRVPTLFSKSAKVWNKGFNWPVCSLFRYPNSLEFSLYSSLNSSAILLSLLEKVSRKLCMLAMLACTTSGKSEESIACGKWSKWENPPWIWKTGQMSPELKSMDVSGR